MSSKWYSKLEVLIIFSRYVLSCIVQSSFVLEFPSYEVVEGFSDGPFSFLHSPNPDAFLNLSFVLSICKLKPSVHFLLSLLQDHLDFL